MDDGRPHPAPRHHGTTYRWVEHIVRNRLQRRIRSGEAPLELPDDPTRYPAWLTAGAETLLATLRATEPETPLWTWAADRHARFWPRRVLHEAVVHRADAELALGRTPHIDPGIAVDGIDEFLTNLPYASWVAERLGELEAAGQTLHLHATDGDGEWLISLGEGGFTWTRGHAKATVAARAPTAEQQRPAVHGA
ncbi:maleylpyruvate isomerase family mycothiol-dependent enzyme [Gandjariella thermophila]|uniref:Mycothiol-dependent maleylpyruvate isomerase metal-binding domain-containing protein n=1 Tax=Gandjariella thermophila TaxID=1931992 RepID=A0A4D4J0C6_9PSEU|nr:maleylpyruvate isomerase family mycothiol-dependent enzyme [Gandjariella thermophila]GDY30065.1 hypothetical protein GTS_16980 [Gandjariella thermophila]